MFFKRIKQCASNDGDSSQVQPVAPRFVIAKDEGLFLRQAEYPWQSQGCRALGRALQRLHINGTFCIGLHFSPMRAPLDLGFSSGFRCSVRQRRR